MIRVRRPAKPPAVLQRRGRPERDRLCTEFDEAPEAYRSGERKFAFERTIYGHATVKKSLADAQHGKCAFCESKITATQPGDVEHFRPKAGYREEPEDDLHRPGYYWLAYEWPNLLFVCEVCNRKHKKNLFPLADPKARALSHHHDIRQEVPLLIDPAAADPESLVGFREEVAYPKDRSRTARKTIELLGLNRPALLERRRDHLVRLKLLRHGKTLLQKKLAGAQSPDMAELITHLSRVDAELAACQQDAAEYAGMARAVLRFPYLG